MREINLREFYPEIYKEDYVVSLPDEIVEVLMEFKRGDTAYRIRTYRYKAYFSLDRDDNIEREMRHHVPSGFDTQVLSTYTYRAFGMGLLGKSSASALILSIFIVGVTFALNKFLRSREVDV